MTKFTDEQIRYLETKIAFLDEGSVKKGFSVRGKVMGNVTGDVEGSVWGDVMGDVRGDVWGSVEGSVRGDVWGSVEGDFERNGIQTGEQE